MAIDFFVHPEFKKELFLNNEELFQHDISTAEVNRLLKVYNQYCYKQ